jgi:hypothetical protein
MLCYAGVCACGTSMFCKHLEGEVWYLCGARYNCLLQCRKPVTDRFIRYIIIPFQFMKSISLGSKIQTDIIKHNESQKQKWVMFSFLGNETQHKIIQGDQFVYSLQNKMHYTATLLKPKHSSTVENKFN